MNPQQQTPNQPTDHKSELLTVLARIAGALERANELREGTNRAITGVNMAVQDVGQHL